MTTYDVNIIKINGTVYKLIDNEIYSKLDSSYSYLMNVINGLQPVSYDVTYTTYTGTEVDLSSYVSYSYLSEELGKITPISYDVTYITYTGTEVDLSSYVSYSYLTEELGKIVPVTYDITYTSGETTIDLSSYATTQYVDEKIDSINVTASYYTVTYTTGEGQTQPIDTSEFVTYSYLSEELEKIVPVTYNVSYTSGETVDLTDYATISYVNDKIEHISISGGYDDSELRQLIQQTNNRIDKFIQGPNASQLISTITYSAQTVNLSELFEVNDLYEYTYNAIQKPISSYNSTIWHDYAASYPSVTLNGNTLSFTENIDVVDLDYKIRISSNSSNYSYDFIVKQTPGERLYFLNGDELELSNYNSRTINLSNYVLTTYTSYSTLDGWIDISSLSSINIEGNYESTTDRIGTITFTNSNEESFDFIIIQPGNPDYDPEGGYMPDGPVETEYELNITSMVANDNPEIPNSIITEENGITVIAAKTGGESIPQINNGTELRLYYSSNSGNTLTISSYYEIIRIEFEAYSYQGGQITANTDV